MLKTVRMVLMALFGLLIMVGAAAGWRYWHIDGSVAGILGFGGLILVGCAFGIDFTL